jgi:hypothetical protein
MANPSHVIINGQEVAALTLTSSQVAGDIVLNDCFAKLREPPGGSTFFSDTAGTIRSGCTPDAMFLPTSADGRYVSSADRFPISASPWTGASKPCAGARPRCASRSVCSS